MDESHHPPGASATPRSSSQRSLKDRRHRGGRTIVGLSKSHRPSSGIRGPSRTAHTDWPSSSPWRASAPLYGKAGAEKAVSTKLPEETSLRAWDLILLMDLTAKSRDLIAGTGELCRQHTSPNDTEAVWICNHWCRG